MLELLFKGLLQWLFDMVIHITEYLADSLLAIFTMDLAYFETAVPITGDIFNIITCLGWALLLGNLVFQSAKTMMSGLGFEGEAPQSLFARTFVMTFFLVFSRQVCDIGLGITKRVMELLETPETVQVPELTKITFHVPGDAGWLLAIIVGVILVVQIVKLFFEIGERYVVLAVLTVLSPLAFAMGGSKSTADIFKGWVRMFGSMCLMVILSLVFLKFMLSAMSVVPTGAEVIPWTIFVVAVAKTGRKVDAMIQRIGLNPASTGDPLGGITRMPGMLAYLTVRSVAQNIGKSVSDSHGGSHRAKRSGGNGTPPPVRPAPSGNSAVRSSAEYENSAQSAERSIIQGNMQGSPQAAGNGGSARQPATRPPMGAAAQNMERNTPQGVQNHTASQAIQNSGTNRVSENGQSLASTQARQTAAPSAARPTVRSRTAETAGRGGMGGMSAGRDSHSYNSTNASIGTAGVQNNPSGVQNGTPQAGRNTANIPSVHTHTADMRNNAVQRNSEISPHSETVSVRQSVLPNVADRRTPAQNAATPRPYTMAGTAQTTPPVASRNPFPHNPANLGRNEAHNRPSLPNEPGINPVCSEEPANAHPFAQAAGNAPARQSGRAAANVLHNESRPQLRVAPGVEKRYPAAVSHTQAGNKPVPEGNQASRKEVTRGTSVQSVERAGNIRRPSDMPHNRTSAGQAQNPSAKPAPPHGRTDAGGRQAQQNPLPKPPPPRGRNGRQGDDRK